MTLFNPYLNLGRNALYLSTIVNGDLDSAAKFERINAAMAESGVQTVVFDRAYNITMPRSETVGGSATSLFVIPPNVGLIVGNPSRVIDMSPMSTLITNGQQRHLFTARGTEGATAYAAADLGAGSVVLTMGTDGMSALGLSIGSKVRITSKKLFIDGGTVILVTTGAVSPTVGEVLTQAGTGATLTVQTVSTASGVTTLVGGGTGVFNTASELTGSTSGALGASSVPTSVDSTEYQGEIATVVAVGSTAFTVAAPLFDTYTVANGARVIKLEPHIGLRMDGVKGIGPGMLRTGADPIANAVTGDRFLHTVYADALRLNDLNIALFDSAGIALYSSDDFEVSGCRVRFETEDAADRIVNQYGIAYINACQDGVIRENTVIGGKHCIVQSESNIAGGVSRRVQVVRNTLQSSWNYAKATHTPAEFITAEANEIHGCSGGIEAGCRAFTSRNNEIRFLKFVAGDLGIGIGVTDIAEAVTSEGDKVYGGGWGFRLDTSAAALFSGSSGPNRIIIKDFYSRDANQDAVRINWTGTGARYDIEITNLRTRNVGRPVDGSGYPTSGTPTGANSFDIRGNASGRLGRVKVDGGNLRGWDTSATQAGYVAYADGVHLSDLSYAGRVAPEIATTCTGGVTSNVNAW